MSERVPYTGGPEADEALDTLFSSHNDGVLFPAFDAPRLVIVTCMDYRVRLNIPDNFAFILRTGGANPRPVEPHLAYSVARAGVPPSR